MTETESRQLHNGLYLLFWKDGGYSLAAVGRNEAGYAWYAPCNWITVPCTNWSKIDRAFPVLTQNGMDRLRDEILDEYQIGNIPGEDN